MHLSIKVAFVLGLALGLAGCQTQTTQPPKVPVLRVMTHDSFSISEPLIAEFESAHQVDVQFIKSGDAGAMLNRAILTKNAPQADLLFGIDNTFLSRALSQNLFLPYESAGLDQVSQEFILDGEHRVTPIDYGDVCINYDKTYFSSHQLALPESLADLTKPEYAGLLVVENPTTSSPGLAFLLATIAEYGPDGYLQYWEALKQNGLVIANDWESAYYTHFSGSSGKGAQPMVVSYATSPAAEVVYAETKLDDSPTASLVGKNMCFRQIEFAGILKGTSQQELARAFLDALLSIPYQEDIPLQMFVYPVNQEAALPVEFTKYVQVPAKAGSLTPEVIDLNREQWLQSWNSTILK